METYQKDQMRTLVAFQNLEKEYARTETMLKEIPSRIHALEEELRIYADAITERETAFTALKKQYTENEAIIREEEEKIKKTNNKLFSIKNNKEYQAALKEVDDVRSRISVLEDRVLACLEKIEADRTSIADEKESFSTMKQRIMESRQGLEAEKRQLDEKLAALEEDKLRLQNEVASSLMKHYLAIRNRGVAVAVAPVADAVCQGCHRKIPPQRYNELQRCDALSFCPHCSRIIYWENGL